MVPFRVDLGGQFNFGVYATEQEDPEFRGNEQARFWSRLGKSTKLTDSTAKLPMLFFFLGSMIFFNFSKGP